MGQQPSVEQIGEQADISLEKQKEKHQRITTFYTTPKEIGTSMITTWLRYLVDRHSNICPVGASTLYGRKLINTPDPSSTSISNAPANQPIPGFEDTSILYYADYEMPRAFYNVLTLNNYIPINKPLDDDDGPSNTLFVHKSIFEIFDFCTKVETYDFYVISASLAMSIESGHSIIVLFNRRQQKFELYDPYGYGQNEEKISSLMTQFHSFLKQSRSDADARTMIEHIDLAKPWSEIETTCPRVGPQAYDEEFVDFWSSYIGEERDIPGYCIFWTLYIIEERIKRPEAMGSTVVNDISNRFEKYDLEGPKGQSMKLFIRDYINIFMTTITRLRIKARKKK